MAPLAAFLVSAQGIALVGAGVAAAGQVQAGRVQKAQAKSQENIMAFNAAVEEREAQAEEQKATFEQQQQAKRAKRIKGALTVGIAKAGGLGSPVAADLAAEQAAELELENLLIGYEGQIAAGRARSQAELDRAQGRIFKQKAKAAPRAAAFRAGSTLLTGFGTAMKG